MAAAYSKINDSSQVARQATLLRILSHWVTATHPRVLGLCPGFKKESLVFRTIALESTLAPVPTEKSVRINEHP
jgi:hypothetical protein